ncbi:MAG: nitrate- and nitrite sensing domain-containing protein, partial [Pseudomonadota bacterium]
MTVLPLVFLLGFAANTVIYLSGSRSSAIETVQNVDAAIVVSNLVHALQAERGASAGFISSGGQSFGARLDRAKAASDDGFSEFSKLEDQLVAFAPETSQKISRTLDGLTRMRQDVLNQNVDVSAASSYYTGKINDLIDMIFKLAKSGAQSDMITTAVAYTSVIYAKENAGLERAMGATGFGSGSFSPRVFEKFLTHGAKQATFLREAEVAAGNTVWAQAVAALSADDEAQITRMRDTARRLAYGGASNVTGPQWFDASTRRIEQLKAVEDHIGQALIGIAKGEAAKSANLLMLIGAACVMIILITATFAYLQIRNISHPLNRFVDGLNRIRDEEYEFEPADTDRRDELGDCARALSDVRDKLQTAAAAQLDNRFKGAAFARANTPMFVIDEDFVVTHANDASLKLFAEKADLIRKDVPSFDPERIVGETLTAFESKLSDMRRQMAEISAAPIKLDLLFSDSRIGVEIAGIFDETDTHLGNVISWDDVSTARTNASKLAVVDASQAVIEFTPYGEITDANDIFLDVTGYRFDEIAGKQDSILVDSKHAQSQDYKEFWEKLRAGERIGGEFKRKGKNG